MEVRLDGDPEVAYRGASEVPDPKLARVGKKLPRFVCIHKTVANTLRQGVD